MNTSDYCIGMNINNPQDRHDAAVLYQTKGPDSKLVKDVVPVTETTIIKKLGEQFTDLAGECHRHGIYGGYSAMGTFDRQGNKRGRSQNHRYFYVQTTVNKGLLVAEVQDGEALQVPAGSHDVLFSFEGVLDRAIERNIPVNPN